MQPDAKMGQPTDQIFLSHDGRNAAHDTVFGAHAPSALCADSG